MLPFYIGFTEILVVSSLKGLLVLGTAWILLILHRGSSAAFRHWIWTLALISFVLIPLLTIISPVWSLPLLPQAARNEPDKLEAYPYKFPGISKEVSATKFISPDVAFAAAKMKPSAPIVDKNTVLPDSLKSPAVQANTQNTLNGSFVLFAIWLLGAIRVFGAALYQQLKIGHITRHAMPLTQPNWLEALTTAATALNLHRQIRLFKSDRIKIPITWGWRKPVIVLPKEAQYWSAERQQIVLRHEMAHIMRYDFLIQWLTVLSCAVHWFNPLVWLANHFTFIERERATDNLVLMSGFKGSDYAQHLLDIARALTPRRSIAASALALAHSSDLEKRIMSILDYRQRRRMLTYSRRILLTLMAFVLVLPLSILRVVPVKAQTTVLSISVRPALADALPSALLKAFEDAHPGVKINLIKDAPCCGNPTDNIDQYLGSVQRYGAFADILYVDIRRLFIAGTRAGYLLDLAPLVAADPDFDTADFYPAAWQAYQWDNGLWALPMSLEPFVIVYDPAAFDGVGLTYPNDQWTLEDFANAARKLAQTRADGTVAQPGARVMEPSILLRSLIDGTLSDSSVKPEVPQFATPEVAALLESWAALENEGVIVSGYGDPGALAVAPMTYYDPRSEQRISAVLPGGKTFLDSVGFAISAGTDSPELAYELVKWLTTRVDVASYFSPVPARKSHAGDLFNSEKSGIDGNTIAQLQQGLETGLSHTDMRFMPYVMSAYDRVKTSQTPPIDALQDAETQAIAGLTQAAERKASIAASLHVEQPAEEEPLPPGKVALKFLINTPQTAGRHPKQSEWEELAREFAASDPQVGRIDFDTSPDNDLPKFAENFDCFFIPGNRVASGGTNLISLDPFMAADSSFDKIDFLGNTLAALQRDGKTYGFPLGIEPGVLQINSDKFTEAGVAVPENGWTVDQFQEALRQLKTDSADLAPLNTSRTDGTELLVLIAAYGGIPLDYRTTPATINFTDMATVTAIQQVLDLARAGYIQYVALGTFDKDMPEPVTTAMYSDTVNTLNAVISMKTGTSGRYYPLVYPQGSQFTGLAYNIEAAYISAKTAYADACYRWISLLSQHPELFDAMPARLSQMNNAALKTAVNPNVMALYTQVSDVLTRSNTVSFPIPDPDNVVPSDFLFRYWLYQAFDDYVLNGKDLNTALKDAQVYAQNYQTCTANMPFAANFDDEAALKPYIECALQVDSRLRPILEPLLNGKQ